MTSPQSPIFKPRNTAVITGGASGIGLALATKCAGYGMNVVICDNNAPNLKSTVELIEGKGVEGKIEGVEMDVSEDLEFEKVKKVVEGWGGKIHLLTLNAGASLPLPDTSNPWTSPAVFQKTLAINTLGITNGLCTLLPLLLPHSTASHPTSIVITGSKQGITNPPGNPAYNASKAAVKSLAEGLSYDLSSRSPTTSVHLLVPGWTFTGLSGNSPFPSTKGKEKPEGAWWPEEVVEYLEAKMREGKFYVICPDNDVSESMDRKRMLWDRLDLVEGRPPLTRWREDYVKEAEEWMAKSEL